MNVPFLDLKAGVKTIREELDAAVAAVFDKCDFVLGEAVARLERDIAGWCGAPHAVAVASGTDALKIALRALGVGQGDEVLTSPATFIATAESVCSLGARPVFIDIDPAAYNISPSLISKFIEEECDEAGGRLVRRSTGGRVAGILPVHLFGQCADMAAILSIAEKHGLFVLEDACQAFGAQYFLHGEHRKPGTLGNAAAFSFYPSKNLGGAGDGGMIVTTDAGLARQCRVLRVHGAERAYEHDVSGFNSRLDTLQAVFLGTKLPHAEAWIRARRQKAASYVRLMQQAAGGKGVQVKMSDTMRGDAMPEAGSVVLPAEAQNCTHAYNVYSIRVADRDGLVAFLRSREIGTHVYYPIPLHIQPVYSRFGYSAGDFPVAEAMCRSVLALPMFPEITEEQQAYVAGSVIEFVSGK